MSAESSSAETAPPPAAPILTGRANVTYVNHSDGVARPVGRPAVRYTEIPIQILMSDFVRGLDGAYDTLEDRNRIIREMHSHFWEWQGVDVPASAIVRAADYWCVHIMPDWLIRPISKHAMVELDNAFPEFRPFGTRPPGNSGVGPYHPLIEKFRVLHFAYYHGGMLTPRMAHLISSFDVVRALDRFNLLTARTILLIVANATREVLQYVIQHAQANTVTDFMLGVAAATGNIEAYQAICELTQFVSTEQHFISSVICGRRDMAIHLMETYNYASLAVAVENLYYSDKDRRAYIRCVHQMNASVPSTRTEMLDMLCTVGNYVPDSRLCTAVCTLPCLESLHYIERNFPALRPTSDDVSGVSDPDIIRHLIATCGAAQVMPYVRLNKTHRKFKEFAVAIIAEDYLLYDTAHPDDELQGNAYTLIAMYQKGFGTHVLNERVVLSSPATYAIAQRFGYVTTPNTLTIAAGCGCESVMYDALQLLRDTDCQCEVGYDSVAEQFIEMTPLMIKLVSDNPAKLTIACSVVCDVAGKGDVVALQAVCKLRKGSRTTNDRSWMEELRDALTAATLNDALDCAMFLIEQPELRGADVLNGFNKARNPLDNSTVIALRKIRTRAMSIKRAAAKAQAAAAAAEPDESVAEHTPPEPDESAAKRSRRDL